jgi:RimJ/RimL family protein N-acetyltransferase
MSKAGSYKTRYDSQDEMLRWLEKQANLPELTFSDAKAIGVEKDGVLVSVLAYHDFKNDINGNMYQCEISGFSVDKRWLNRHNLIEFFAYPFIQLSLKRVQMLVSVHNEGVNCMLPKMGFKKEGLLRKGYFDLSDAYLWSIVK